MKITPEIKEIYTGIQHQLSNLIPEKWESIYLYASVSKQLGDMETWEMYFYYIPKSFVKKNPVNVYEIPSRFNVDEKEYLGIVDNLCSAIKLLYTEYQNAYQKSWANMIISIKNSQFLVEFNSDNLIELGYTSQDKHRIFKHKYLNVPLQNFKKEEREVIERFIENEEYKMVFDRYFEYIPKADKRNFIEYEKDEKFEEDLYSSQITTAEEKKTGFWRVILNFLKNKHARLKYIGVSPSGKASDSDSDIPVFESQYPNQIK